MVPMAKLHTIFPVWMFFLALVRAPFSTRFTCTGNMKYNVTVIYKPCNIWMFFLALVRAPFSTRFTCTGNMKYNITVISKPCNIQPALFNNRLTVLKKGQFVISLLDHAWNVLLLLYLYILRFDWQTPAAVTYYGLIKLK